MKDKPPDTIKLLVLGTGPSAVDVTDLIDDIPNLEVMGYVVNVPPYEKGDTLLGLPIYWIDEISQFVNSYLAVAAIGTTKRNNFIQQVESMGMSFSKITHPTARVSSKAQIGAGTVINAGVQIATHTRIGRHVMVNRGALIGHHNDIHDYVTIAPGAVIGGSVSIGERTWIGLGANVLENVSIGKQSIIGAGSLVMRDVPDRVKVMGVPGVIIEREVDGL